MTNVSQRHDRTSKWHLKTYLCPSSHCEWMTVEAEFPNGWRGPLPSYLFYIKLPMPPTSQCVQQTLPFFQKQKLSKSRFDALCRLWHFIKFLNNEVLRDPELLLLLLQQEESGRERGIISTRNFYAPPPTSIPPPLKSELIMYKSQRQTAVWAEARWIKRFSFPSDSDSLFVKFKIRIKKKDPFLAAMYRLWYE